MIDAGFIIELGAKSLLVAGVALVLLRLSMRRTAAERSWIAHLGLVALVLLPLAVWLMPGWNPLPASALAEAPNRPAISAEVLIPQIVEAKSGAAAAVQATSPPEAAIAAVTLPSAAELAVWVYAIPTLLLLLAMLVAVVRLGAMHRRANVLVESSWLSALALAQRRMGFKHGTALLVSKDLHSPVSWGLMRPIILLNEDAVRSTGEAEAIIAHELAHVARLDWAKLLIARLACALFWFNPLVWRLAREAHQLREEAADDAVLLSEVDGAEYASLLVNAARHDNRALLMAAHGVAPSKDSLKRRITRVLDVDQARGPANAAWIAVCVLALVGVAAPLAAFDPLLRAAAGDDAAMPGAVGPQGSLPSRLAAVALPGELVGPGTELPHPVEAGSVTPVAAHAGDNDEVENLIAYKAVGMTPQYIGDLRAAGFPNATMEELTDAKAVGVTPEFARQVRNWDSSATLEEVVEAKAVGISPAYFGEMRPLVGGSFEDIVQMAALGVSSTFVRDMRSVFGSIDGEAISELAALGVTEEYARQMRALFPGVDADSIVEMKAVGVTPAFVREMRRQGLSVDDPDEAVEGRLFSQRGPRGRVGPDPASLPRPGPRPGARASASASAD